MNGKIAVFLKGQSSQFYKGGLAVLWQKLVLSLLCLLALPLVLAVRLLGPFILIRFGPLVAKRIGHLAAETEIYLCEREAGLHGGKAVDIFYYVLPMCNSQLKKMLERVILVFPFARYLDKVSRFLAGSQKHVIPLRRNQPARDIHCLLAYTPPHLSFTQEEEEKGMALRRKLGIPDNAGFICFYARDPLYLDKALPGNNWKYQNFRDSSIHNYLPAAEELTKRGYYALRMGFIVKDALNTKNPKIIDYANNGRSDFMDIFISAKCKFFISAAAGLSGIPMIFRRPIAWVNFIPLEYVQSWSPQDLFIPKKLWLKGERRLMTFSEILKSGAGRFKFGREYDALGIEAIENTPEEITALALEMEERLKGTFFTTKEDEDMQQRFWELFKGSDLQGKFLSRIGAEFLRQNKALLE